MVGWLKHGSNVGKLEISDLPCFDVEEIQLNEIGMLELICHLRPTQPHWKGPENIRFATTMINNCMRGASPRVLEELCHHSSWQAGSQDGNYNH